MLVEALKSVTLHYTSLRTLLKEYVLNCDLRLGQPYDHVNQRRHFTPRLVPINMLISTNMASTRPTERTKDVDEAEDEASGHIKEIVIGIHTVEDMYTEEDTREAKEIKDSDKRSATFVTNKAAGRQSTPPRNAREHTKGFANKLYTQQSKMSPPNSTAASLSSTKDLKELTILLLPPNLIQSSLCQ